MPAINANAPLATLIPTDCKASFNGGASANPAVAFPTVRKEKYKAIADILEQTLVEGNATVDARAVHEDFKEMLKEAYADLNVTAYDGVEELFGTLKSNGIKVVLNTGYDRKTAQSLLDKLGWEPGNQIDALITADDVVNGRPSSEMIDKAMAMFNISDSSELSLSTGTDCPKLLLWFFITDYG